VDDHPLRSCVSCVERTWRLGASGPPLNLPLGLSSPLKAGARLNYCSSATPLNVICDPFSALFHCPSAVLQPIPGWQTEHLRISQHHEIFRPANGLQDECSFAPTFSLLTISRFKFAVSNITAPFYYHFLARF
jgi:hypothetical protein